MIYHTRGEHTNHYTSDVIAKVMKVPSEIVHLHSLFKFSLVHWCLRKELKYEKIAENDGQNGDDNIYLAQ